MHFSPRPPCAGRRADRGGLVVLAAELTGFAAPAAAAPTITQQGTAGHPFTWTSLPSALEVVDGDEGDQDLRLALTAIDRIGAGSPIYGDESCDARSVEALDNGNLLFSDRSLPIVAEVTRAGEPVWTYSVGDDPDLQRPFSAQRFTRGGQAPDAHVGPRREARLGGRRGQTRGVAVRRDRREGAGRQPPARPVLRAVLRAGRRHRRHRRHARSEPGDRGALRRLRRRRSGQRLHRGRASSGPTGHRGAPGADRGSSTNLTAWTGWRAATSWSPTRTRSA